MHFLRILFRPWAPRADQRILELLGTIMSKIDELTAAVAAEGTVIDSAVTLLTTLSTDLQNALNSGEDGAVQTVIDGINAKTAELAAAVTANTPAAAPAEPAPEEAPAEEAAPAAGEDAGTTGQ